MTKIQWNIDLHETLRSTQDHVREKAQAGTGAGLVVQARSQTGGMGRQGRSWVSPAGNLYLSALLPAGTRPVSEIAFVAALAVYETASKFVSGLMLKWPNDVLRDGKKLAGILIENSGEKGIIVGIGMNITAPPPDAAALGDYDVLQARTILLEQLQHYYSLWQEQGFVPIRALWLERSHKPGAALTANGQSGTFESIDHDGALLLRDTHNIVHRLTAGDVNLVSGQ